VSDLAQPVEHPNNMIVPVDGTLLRQLKTLHPCPKPVEEMLFLIGWRTPFMDSTGTHYQCLVIYGPNQGSFPVWIEATTPKPEVTADEAAIRWNAEIVS
jgi:hypothetical protein